MSSVNGSSPAGHCSNSSNEVTFGSYIVTCTAPSSSVVFDGNIPTLTELNGSMWASQLLTLTILVEQEAHLNFDFSGTAGYRGVNRIEVVMFNCPQWGIAADTITVYRPTKFINTGGTVVLSNVTYTITSCDSLVRVCISCPLCLNETVLGLAFVIPHGSNWTHIAEISFHHDRNLMACPLVDTTTLTTPADTTTSVMAIPPGTTNGKLSHHILRSQGK